MEPDIMPLHSSSPPPLDDDGEGEAGSEEDEFGDFGGFALGVSCSTRGFADSSDSSSSLRHPSPVIKPATHQPCSSLNHPVEQSQPTSTVNSGASRSEMEKQDCNADSCVRLTNGYSEGDHNSGTHISSAVDVCSPGEETGFADFTVFAEQAAHPWCCGFSPSGSSEQWDSGAVGSNFSNNLREQICDPETEVVMDSEPISHGACQAKEDVCTVVKHCEKRDAAPVRPSQDHHQPQDAASAFPSEEPHCGDEEESGKPGDGRGDGRRSFNCIQSSEVQEEPEEDRENSISTVPQTFSVYESASEDMASLCDDEDLSFEGPSADLEPNVSSLASQEDQTDCDHTDNEEEELGNYSHSHSFVSSTENLKQSKAERGFHNCDQSATQETSSTSNHSQSGTHSGDKFADFKDSCFADHRDPGQVQTADAGVQILGNLPPSDSFADFCSAPTQEDGEESWAEFKDQRIQEEGKTWTQFRGQVSSLQTDGEAEEEQDRAEQSGLSRRNSCQASLSCRVQQLLLASFPEVAVPAVEDEEEVLSLGALLHTKHLPQSEEEDETPQLRSRSEWIQWGMWWPHQDLHSAVGLQFQWGGSHTNRTLLRCLGVDTRNIVFIGMKKQPVAVPAFASSLGMLEPTKDSVPAVCSPGHTVDTAQAPPGSRDTLDSSKDSMQEASPSSQLDWNSRGLSSSQDEVLSLPLVSTGCFAFNLDYFGPEEESRSCSSSSSCSNSPPPGVDRELYELTIGKVETSINSTSVEDTLNRLMSCAEKSSISVRKPQQDEELSVEACRVISGLPDLSFMQAKVLMFPSILVPEECCSL